MKKLSKVIFTMTIGTLLLTGCGTIKETSGGTTPQEQGSTPSKEIEHEVQPEDRIIRLMEQNLTYDIEGEKHEETGFLLQSKNQGFSMYAFDGWKLEAEEPGKDILEKFKTHRDS
jgi:hypothetical protein